MKYTNKELYPRLCQLNINIVDGCVNADELESILLKNNLSIKKFDYLFGIQTVSDKGLYAWDVEAVLERMLSGKITGTQLNWD